MGLEQWENLESGSQSRTEPFLAGANRSGTPRWQILLASFLIILIVLAIHRITGTFFGYRQRPQPRVKGTPTHLMIVLGSGGHTAEMLSILRSLNTEKYIHRTYIVSSGDEFSSSLAYAFEARLREREAKGGLSRSYSRVITVPRARKVHQSLITTPWSCLRCLMTCLQVMRRPWSLPAEYEMSDDLVQRTPKTGLPDVILTNGPATGVIVVVASYLLRITGAAGSRDGLRTIYVESWARVRRLSLSGKIMLWLADRFVVQWESLKPATRGRGEYLGSLIE